MKFLYENNIFTKIIAKEIPSETILENNNFLVIKDINPQAKIHLLILPKKNYVNYLDFFYNASNEEKYTISNVIEELVKKLHIKNFSLNTNNGPGSGQIIFHYHVHFLSND